MEGQCPLQGREDTPPHDRHPFPVDPLLPPRQRQPHPRHKDKAYKGRQNMWYSRTPRLIPARVVHADLGMFRHAQRPLPPNEAVHRPQSRNPGVLTHRPAPRAFASPLGPRGVAKTLPRGGTTTINTATLASPATLATLAIHTIVNSATPATVISATPTTVTLVDRRAAKERAENTHATRGR